MVALRPSAYLRPTIDKLEQRPKSINNISHLMPLTWFVAFQLSTVDRNFWQPMGASVCNAIDLCTTHADIAHLEMATATTSQPRTASIHGHGIWMCIGVGNQMK